MTKNILIAIVLIVLIGAWVVYYQSSVQPNDIYIATSSQTNVQGQIDTTDDLTQPLDADINAITGEVVTWWVELTPDTVVDYTIEDGSYNLSSNSTFARKATKPGWAHNGSIQITDGSVTFADNKIVAGEFMIDMSTIELLDINNESFEAEIRDEFFEAPRYPTTTLMITDSTTQGDQLIVSADLTIKDQTHPITFPVTITNNNYPSIKTSFAIDRNIRGLTMWKWSVNDYLEFDLDLKFDSPSR